MQIVALGGMPLVIIYSIYITDLKETETKLDLALKASKMGVWQYYSRDEGEKIYTRKYLHQTALQH